MKKIITLLAVMGILCGMALFCGTVSAADKPIIIKIAGHKPEGEPETVGMHQFGKYLGELSKGKYEVQVYPNSQLGKEDSYIDQTRRGIIQMCATGTQMSKFHPAMAMLEMPMLFDDLDHAHRAMNGKTFELITKGFDEKSGIHTLNAFPLGYRRFYTNFAKEAGISGQLQKNQLTVRPDMDLLHISMSGPNSESQTPDIRWQSCYHSSNWPLPAHPSFRHV